MSHLFSGFKKSPTLTLWVLAIVVATGAIETDIFVPSFPAIKDYFNTTEVLVQMIVGLNLFGLCISSLIYGPLADAYGRRPVLLFGNIFFLMASIGCILSDTIESLLVWRFIQGLGTSVVFIVPGTIIYDMYDKEYSAKALGWFGALITFSMAFAPMLGSYIHETFEWQANFIFIGALSLISFILTLGLIYETLPPEKRVPLNYKAIGFNYLKVLTSRTSFWYMLIICCLFAGYLVYISNLSLIFIDHLNVDESIYSYYQGAFAFTFAVFSFLSGKCITRFGILRVRNIGFVLSLLGGFGLLFVALFAADNALFITLIMCVYSAGFGLCCGILFGDFIYLFPDIKGAAASLASFIRLLFISAMILLASYLFNGTIVPIAWMISCFCMVMLLAWIALSKKTES